MQWLPVRMTPPRDKHAQAMHPRCPLSIGRPEKPYVYLLPSSVIASVEQTTSGRTACFSPAKTIKTPLQGKLPRFIRPYPILSQTGYRQVYNGSSNLRQRGSFMSCHVIRFITFDFVLRIILGSMMGMALIIKIAGMDPDDHPGDPAGLGIPTHVISLFKSFCHSKSRLASHQFTTGSRQTTASEV